MDRNTAPNTVWSNFLAVALRKESVDRNTTPTSVTVRPVAAVALRKESVDRNTMRATSP